jgi:hypothetical protein
LQNILAARLDLKVESNHPEANNLQWGRFDLGFAVEMLQEAHDLALEVSVVTPFGCILACALSSSQFQPRAFNHVYEHFWAGNVTALKRNPSQISSRRSHPARGRDC